MTDPTPKKGNPPANWRDRFLASLAKYGNVSAAARSARVTRTYVYDVRKADESFAYAWDTALDDAADAMEYEAWKRAVKGVKKPIYQGGMHVADVQDYSDTLLIFLLKAARPEKFRERFQVDATVDAGLIVTEVVIGKTHDKPVDD